MSKQRLPILRATCYPRPLHSEGASIVKILVKNRLFFFVLLLTLCFFTYWHFHNRPAIQSEETTKVVAVTKVQQQDLRETINLIGTLQPKQNTQLFAKANGVLTLLVTPGQQVTKGTLLAKIDNPNLVHDEQLTSRSVAINQDQYRRMQSLVNKGYVSAKELEDKKQAIIQGQINLNKAKMDLDATHYYAPFSGVIGALKIPTGSQVNLGDPILTLYDPLHSLVQFDIPCSNTQPIHAGQSVEIDGKLFPIAHVQNLLNDKNHMCPADVEYECQDCLLGNSIQVGLVLQEKKQTMVVPFSALFLHNGEQSVYVVEKNQLALKPVKTGIQNKNLIEIISGIAPNAELITQGQERLMAGMPVKVAEKSV